MNGWCLWLVCLGVAMVKAEELSEFRKEKVDQFFTMADRDGDGTLEKSDYVLTADNVLTIPNYDKYNASYLRSVIVDQGWEMFPNREMTLPEMEDAFEALDEATLKGLMYAYMKHLYDVWDYLAALGCLSKEELASEFSNAGKQTDLDEQAAVALVAIDADKDGCATLAEYQACSLSYFTSEDRDDPCTQFLGILGVY